MDRRVRAQEEQDKWDDEHLNKRKRGRWSCPPRGDTSGIARDDAGVAMNDGVDTGDSDDMGNPQGGQDDRSTGQEAGRDR